jgi:hypothetical protein
MSTSKIIKEALSEADKIHSLAVDVAKQQLFDAFSEKVKKSVSRALDETVSVGKDVPSGYDQDEDQDALAYGSSRHSTAKKDDINKGGKGPQKLEGSAFDEAYEEEELDETSKEDEDLDEASKEDEDELDEKENIDDLDVVPIKEASDEDEELDESSDEDEELDEMKDEDELDEASDEYEELDERKKKKVQHDEPDGDEAEVDDDAVVDVPKDKEAVLEHVKLNSRKLRKENFELKKAFNILREKFNDVNLLNTKLAGALKFVRNPNLTLRQKEAIVETYDRARNVREVKLITATLVENYKITSSARKNIVQKPIKPASSKLTESLNESSRLQELAGIKKLY